MTVPNCVDGLVSILGLMSSGFVVSFGVISGWVTNEKNIVLNNEGTVWCPVFMCPRLGHFVCYCLIE